MSVNVDVGELKIKGLSFPPGSVLRAEYVDGKKEGQAVVFSVRRIKLAHLSFHQDLLDGFCIFFNEKGPKERECVYHKGIRNGWIREFEDGEVVFTGICRDGEKYSELRKLNQEYDYWEEIKDNKRIGIWKFNGNDYLEGDYYFLQNNVLLMGIHFQYGEKDRVFVKFDKNIMKQYDQHGNLSYIGSYEISLQNGIQRIGKGEEYHYCNGKLSKISKLNNGIITRYIIIENDKIKEYNNNQLIYEGNWYNDHGIVVRHGEGTVYSSSTIYYTAIFEKGQIKRRLYNIYDKQIVLFDENERVIYKGKYDMNYQPVGKGFNYEYENNRLVRVFVCEDGKNEQLKLEIKNHHMFEYDENGMKIYEGDYFNNHNGIIVRNGEGDLLDKNDMLVYSGKWLNGKRHGKGNFFKNGDLVFEGEWKDDKPNGEGKYLNSNGDILYKGLWKNGYYEIEKGIWLYYEDGKKYELYENGTKKYEGEWKNGKLNGIGCYYRKNGTKKYEGEWKNGILEGKAIHYYQNGKKKYEGYYHNNELNGEGKSYNENGIINYEGEFKNGCFDGKGIRYDENGVKRYEGDFRNNKIDGYGIAYNDDGKKRYEGEWKNGKYEGKGTGLYEDGSIAFDGYWKEGQPEGKGSCYYRNNKKGYEGEWKNGREEGNGIWFYDNGIRRYEGEWKNGYPNGHGIYYDRKGFPLYEGNWINGYLEIGKNIHIHYKTGHGEIRDTNNELIYEGKIMNLRPNGNGKCYFSKDSVYEGEWKKGVLQVNDSLSIYYQDGAFYKNIHPVPSPRNKNLASILFPVSKSK